ncbi:MAG: terpene cyclase/mutase family protein, partial [Planctomycetes bacterium]|nr:terpene cyclase/mutase family protein [Planctomycetota bacterium]
MNALVLISTALIGTPVPEELVRSAVERGISRLETSATSYVKNRSCFSCHHQATSLLALASAKEHGFRIDGNVFDKQVEFTAKFFKDKEKEIRDGRGIGGANTTAGYALFTLKIAKHPHDSTTCALVEFLLKKQQANGSWTPTMNRPPSEGSAFTTGALSLLAFEHYRPADGCDDELRKRIDNACEKGLEFLLSGKPQTTEDRVFLLWGLIAGKAEAADIAKVRDELIKRQRSDGGWAQLEDAASDAYATGSVMMVLRASGISPSTEVYRRGVRYLVLTQHESGGWIVPTR